MTNYVFDSYALLVLFRKEKGYEKIIDLLASISSGKGKGFISVINIGEIYYITYRKQGKDSAELAFEAIENLNLEIVNADLSLTLEAAKIKAHHKLSYADAFALALAKMNNATLITGNIEFKQFEKEVKINWI